MHTQCPKCRAWNPEGRSTCVQCGGPLPAEAVAAGSERPRVGADVARAGWRPSVGALVLFCLICLVCLGLVALWPVRPQPHRHAVCLPNVKNITLAFQMYLVDNDEVFPPAAEWCDTLGEYVKNYDVYRCPRGSDIRCGYAYNMALSGVRSNALAEPTATIIIFESDWGWNATGGRELLVSEPRHREGDNYGLADGRAAWAGREKVLSGEAGVRWEP